MGDVDSQPTELQKAVAIDAICDRFESALKRGEEPDLGAALKEVDAAARPDLFQHLLAAQLSMSAKPPEVTKLLEKFPDYRGEVVKVCSPGVETMLREIQPDGRYESGDEVARGGMGAIRLAEDKALRRQVAVKSMLAGEASPDELARFIEEAQITGQLDHPGIVPIHEIGVDGDGRPFYAMQYVRGRDLQAVLKEGEYSLRQLLAVLNRVCDAVAFAHSRGVLHRDLKPANIRIGEFGEVYVMDWGLAKVVGGSDHVADVADVAKIESIRGEDATGEFLTVAGSVMGSPQYMSPEQAGGAVQDLDVRADVYALGAILYEILTLRPPITVQKGEDIFALLERVKRGKIEPPRVNEAMGRVAMKALATRREDRYANVAEFQSEIEAWLGGFATEAEQAGLGKQLMLLIKRNKAIFSTAVAAWMVITGLVVWFVLGLQRSERETRNALGQSQISLAEAAYLAGDGQRALTYLDQTPEAIRDTRWDYLHRYSDESIYRRLTQSFSFRGVFLDPHESGRSYLYTTGGVLDRFDSRSGKSSSSGGRSSRVRLDLDFKPNNVAIALSPDGKHLAVAARMREGGIQIFRTDTFEKVKRLESSRFKSLIKKGFFSADSRTLILRSGEDSETYDLETGERNPIEGVRGMAAIPESSRWIGLQGNQLVAFESDGSPAAILCSNVPGGILDLSVSHDGNIAAAARTNGSIDLYDLKSGERFKTLAAYESIAYKVMFSRNSPVLLSFGADGQIGSLRFWSSDWHSQRPLRTVFVRENGYDISIAWDEEEELILVALAELNIYRAPSNSSDVVHQGGHSVKYVDESTAAFTFGNQDGEPVMVTFDLEAGKIVEQFPGYTEIVHSRTREISAAGWLEYATHNHTHKFPILYSSPDLELDGVQVPQIRLSSMDTLAISPEGRYFAASSPEKLFASERNSSGNWVEILERENSKGGIPLGIVNRQTFLLFPQADSPMLLASFLVQPKSTPRRVFQWYDLESGSLIGSGEDPVASSCMLLDPTGTTLIAGAPDGSVYGKDPLNLEQRYVVRVHDEGVDAIAVSPDGNLLATSSAGLVRIWRLENGRPTEMLRELIGNIGPVNSIDFSPRSNRLITSAGFHVREFDLSDLSPESENEIVRRTVANSNRTETADLEPDPLLVPVVSEPGKALDGYSLARVLATSKWSDPAPVHLEMEEPRNEHYEPFLSPGGEHCYLSLWKQSRWNDVFRFSLTEDPERLRFDRELGEQINSNKRDLGFCTASGGAIAALARNDGPSENFQIRLFRRSADGAFNSENERIAESVSSLSNDMSPTLSGDGLILVFVSDRSGSLQLWEARRDNIEDPFRPPEMLSIRKVGFSQFKAPSLSADGKLLLFTGVSGVSENIHFSVRESIGGLFRAPIPLVEINHPDATDNSAQISSDGRVLYFLSRRDSPENKLRLFVCKRIERGEADGRKK